MYRPDTQYIVNEQKSLKNWIENGQVSYSKRKVLMFKYIIFDLSIQK